MTGQVMLTARARASRCSRASACSPCGGKNRAVRPRQMASAIQSCCVQRALSGTTFAIAAKYPRWLAIAFMNLSDDRHPPFRFPIRQTRPPRSTIGGGAATVTHRRDKNEEAWMAIHLGEEA